MASITLTYINYRLVEYNFKLFDLGLTFGSILIAILQTENFIQKSPEKFVFNSE